VGGQEQNSASDMSSLGIDGCDADYHSLASSTCPSEPNSSRQGCKFLYAVSNDGMIGSSNIGTNCKTHTAEPKMSRSGTPRSPLPDARELCHSFAHRHGTFWKLNNSTESHILTEKSNNPTIPNRLYSLLNGSVRNAVSQWERKRPTKSAEVEHELVEERPSQTSCPSEVP